MKRSFSYISILIVGSILFACEPDSIPLVSPNASEAEKAYFEDYESPMYKWGFVDVTGEKKIDGIYDDTRDFNEGLAAANLNGRWGYIDNKGNTIIPHDYPQANPFDNGIALVRTFEDKWRFIDKTGKSLSENEYESCTMPKHKLSVVSNGVFKGVINHLGEMLIPINFEAIKIVNEKHILVRKNGKFGILNLNNEEVIPTIYDKINIEGENTFAVKKEGKYQYFTNEGKVIIDQYFDKALPFYYEFTIVKNEDFSLIDKSGNIIKNFDYKTIQYAGENKWKFKENGLWGIMDKNGNPLTEAKYKFLNRFSEGIIVYGINDKSWGYLSDSGKEITEPKYALVWDFKNNYARVLYKNGIAFIGKDGSEKIGPKFFEVRDFYEDLARYQVFR